MAGRLDLDRHAHGDAAQRVVEGEPDARLEVYAALGPRPCAPAATAEDAADPPMKIGEIEVGVLEADVLERAAGTAPAAPIRPNASYCFRLSGSESTS